METPETRLKIANAIKDLQSQGKADQIPQLVSAYKIKYKSQQTTEPTIEQQRQERRDQGLPVAQNPNRVEPTFGGEIVRAPLKLGASILSGAGKAIGGLAGAITGNDEMLLKNDPTVPIKSDYLGDIHPVGYDKKGVNIKKGVGQLAELASYAVGGEVLGALPSIATQGFKGAGTQLLKQSVPLIKEGALAGGLGAGGVSMQEGNNFGKVAVDTLGGVLAGGVLAPVTALGFKGLGAGTKGIMNKLDPEIRQSQLKEKALKDLTNIEDNYSVLRKKQKYSKDGLHETRNMVLDSNILNDESLPNIIDETGSLKTDAAKSKYYNDYIGGREGVVRDNLDRLGIAVDPNTIENYLIKNAYDKKSGLSGKALQSAINNIKDEVAGYRLRANQDGLIPLTELHDAKINTTQGINFFTPADVKAYSKNLAKGLKEIVETQTPKEQFDIQKVNNELKKHYQVIDYLEGLNGKKVQGGKLGKYFAQVSGNIIGGAVGSTMGPIGSATGTVIGGEIASRIKGANMSRTFKGFTGKGLPKSKILQDAVNKAKSPRTAITGSTENILGNTNTVKRITPDDYSYNLGNRNTIYNSPNTITKKVIPTVSNTTENKASIPVMMTNKLRADLKNLGYTADDIANLKPIEANKIVNEGIKPKTTIIEVKQPVKETKKPILNVKSSIEKQAEKYAQSVDPNYEMADRPDLTKGAKAYKEKLTELQNDTKSVTKDTPTDLISEAKKYKSAEKDLSIINKQISELSRRGNLTTSEQGILKLQTERNRLESLQATAERTLKDIENKTVDFHGEKFTIKDLNEPANGIVFKTSLKDGEYYPIKKQNNGGYRAINLKTGQLVDIPPTNTNTYNSGGWNLYRSSLFDDKTVADVLDSLKSKTDNFYNQANKPETLLQKFLKPRDGFVATGFKNEGNSLMAIHNLSEDNLKFSNKTGGIANPSIGIVDSNKQELRGFGDISLIGDKDLIDPKKMRKGYTFGADIYSPRHPKADLEIPVKNRVSIENDLKKYENKTGDHLYNVDFSDIQRSLENSALFKAKFLDDNNIKLESILDESGNPDKYKFNRAFSDIMDKEGMYDKFTNTVVDYLNKNNAEYKLFGGYTPSGKIKNLPATAENASKLMNKEALQSGENFFYGLGNIRAKLIKKFPNLESIKKDKNRILNTTDFEKSKDIIETKFYNLKDKLDKYSINKNSNQFTESDSQINAIGDYMTGNKSSFNNKFSGVPDTLINDINNLSKELVNMPTEYFETKYKRPVGINEFKAAVVPDNVSKDTLEILKRNGITDIIKYNKDLPNDRLNKIKEYQKYAFSLVGASTSGLGPLGAISGASAIGMLAGTPNKTQAKEIEKKKVILPKNR